MRVLGTVGAVLVLAGTAATSASAADSIYWTNYGPASKLSWVALDGSRGGDLPTTGATIGYPGGVAIDAAAGRVYWANTGANPGGGSIAWARLDGTGGGNLVTTGASMNFPDGLAIDPAAGRVYWANAGANKISFANTNGSGGGDIPTTGATVKSPAGVAVDPAARRIYWANADGDKISFANLDGPGGGDLTTPGATVKGPIGVAVDPAAGRIYWANTSANKISFAKLDGTGGADVTTTGATVDSPSGVAVDAAAGRVYWASYKGNKVSFARLDGTGGADLPTLTATVSTPQFPVLLQRPANATAPVVSGDSRIGSTLGCSDGTWAPDVLPAFVYRVPQTLAYAWTRDGATVADATGKTLTASQAGAYRCTATATNQAGATTATSAPLAVGGGSTAPVTPTTPTTPSTGPRARVAIVGVAGRTLTVRVNSAGTVRVSGPRRLVRTSTQSGGPGRVSIGVQLTRTAARRLRHHHRLRLAVSVRFTPDGGRGVTVAGTIVLRAR